MLRESLREAIGSLEREQRTLLRFYYVDDLRVEEIGVLLKVNKSTVSRRLADARDTILAALRKALAVRLKLSRSEVDTAW